MIHRNVFIYSLMVAGLIFAPATVTAQQIAIVENFPDPEIDSLQSYLGSMGLTSLVIGNEVLEYDSVAGCDLLIWDDLSYQSNGITDSNVIVFQQFYQSGKPLYFIGDDLAYSIVNLSPEWASVWTDLLHLSGIDNFSSNYTVQITDTTNPVTNGAYGRVNDFQYDLDIDSASRTGTGELPLGATATNDVLLSYDGPSARTVTQNCMVFDAGPDASIAERMKLFKNAIAWLLHNEGVSERGRNLKPAESSLVRNYPNPFNPATTFEFSVPHSGLVTLRIFNTLGKVVATLVSEELKPGDYRTSWNASGFPSGAYFYRLQVGSLSQTRNLLLLK